MTMFASQWFANSGEDHEIEQSIRFNDNDSAHLSRTPSSASNRRTWTFSAWMKRCNLGTRQGIFAATGQGFLQIGPDAASAEVITLNNEGSGTNLDWYTDAVYRDPSAWMHIVWQFDSTQSTADDRTKLWVNGSRITDFTKVSTPDQNLEGAFNNNVEHKIGEGHIANFYLDAYLAEIHFIDGTAKEASDFGKTSSTTGQWVPKKYSGSYGTNGFYLKGESSSDLGNDSSGNNNDFSSSGLAAADQVIDTPTNNFATYSPINIDSVTLADGNLFCDSSGYWSGAAATMSIPSASGKWYIENLVGNRYGSYACQGFVPANYQKITSAGEAIYYASYGGTYGSLDWGFGVNMNQSKFGFYVGGSGTAYNIYKPDGSTSLYSTGDLYFCHALDLDNERYWVGTALTTDSSVTWWGPSGSGADPTNASTGVDISSWLDVYGKYGGLLWFHSANQSSGTPDSTIDFGQHGFNFTKPTGYSRLCTADLSDPAIADPSAYFQTTTYSGNGSSQSINQAGNSTFEPSMVWIKSRSATTDHVIQDQVRGNFVVYPNQSSAEGATGGGWVSSFDSDGFTVASNAPINDSGQTFVGWQWKAAGSGSSNTDGSISSTVSADTTSGFSIATYTGTGANATVGHGLGVAPKMIIIKNRADTDSWVVYHEAIGATKAFALDTSAAASTASTFFNDTAPTSSVFTVGTGGRTNGSSDGMIAYCFAEVAGFSSIGSYIGTGSADGPVIHTGFKPNFIIIKGGQNWVMWDIARSPYNQLNNNLWSDLNSAESTSASYARDILSDGFKLRGTHAIVNGSSTTYVYIAFAESPFKTATVL